MINEKNIKHYSDAHLGTIIDIAPYKSNTLTQLTAASSCFELNMVFLALVVLYLAAVICASMYNPWRN